MGFPVSRWYSVKNLAVNAREQQETWVRCCVGRIPWRRKWQPTPVFLPGRSCGQKSLVGYSLCICAKLLQLCLTLCDLTDCSPPGSSVHGILQARILGWVAVFFSRGSSQPRDRTCVSESAALEGKFFTTSATWEAHGVAKSWTWQHKHTHTHTHTHTHRSAVALLYTVCYTIYFIYCIILIYMLILIYY